MLSRTAILREQVACAGCAAERALQGIWLATKGFAVRGSGSYRQFLQAQQLGLRPYSVQVGNDALSLVSVN